ncbi:oxalate/formate MFS antiporter [Spirillospora sp. NPDC048911]|uniref:oxalate/formate MFS antiporter n=1 Tax=Spirillospora sp. NPDC048911 TaxID=3364527 RepID=UPI003722C82E
MPVVAHKNKDHLVPGFTVNRWWVLVSLVVSMMAIANLQYAWTLFTDPLETSLGAELTAVQFAFTAFVFTETWLVPVEGWLVDRFGPRLVMLAGAVLIAASWVGSGLADDIYVLWAVYAVGGVGAGAIYGSCVGTALKWFPDHRGLCAGLVAGGYGAGTALTIVPISRMIDSSGYRATFITFGIVQGIVVALAALFVRSPAAGWQPPDWAEKERKIRARVRMSTRDFTWRETLRQPAFWALYLVMMMMAFTGLVMTAQLKPIGKDYGMDEGVLWLGTSALVLALLVDRVLNGVCRPFWGWVSDHIGRETALTLAFGFQFVVMLAWITFIEEPVAFVVLTALAFFSWGEIYSLFPATVGDLFGRAHATTNYGMLYTSKGMAAFFAAPGAAWLASLNGGSGQWIPVLWAMAGCSALATLLTWFLIRPLVKQAVGELPAPPAAEEAAAEAIP